MNLTKLCKRKWDAVIDIRSGKWFTGRQSDIKSESLPSYKWIISETAPTPTVKETIINPPKHRLSEVHDIHKLSLRLEGTSRGRSSAIFVFRDNSGYRYNMSMSGGEKLLKAFFADVDGKTIQRDGEYITANFVQTKQGANYFIEVIEEK